MFVSTKWHNCAQLFFSPHWTLSALKAQNHNKNKTIMYLQYHVTSNKKLNMQAKQTHVHAQWREDCRLSLLRTSWTPSRLLKNHSRTEDSSELMPGCCTYGGSLSCCKFCKAAGPPTPPPAVCPAAAPLLSSESSALPAAPPLSISTNQRARGVVWP